MESLTGGLVKPYRPCYTLVYVAGRVNNLAIENLLVKKEQCVAGFDLDEKGELVPNDCVSMIDYWEGKPGFDEAQRLALDLVYIAKDVGSHGAMESRFHTLNSDPLPDFDWLLKLKARIESVRDNGFVTFTALKCSADEAFTQLDQLLGKGDQEQRIATGRKGRKDSASPQADGPASTPQRAVPAGKASI